MLAYIFQTLLYIHILLNTLKSEPRTFRFCPQIKKIISLPSCGGTKKRAKITASSAQLNGTLGKQCCQRGQQRGLTAGVRVGVGWLVVFNNSLYIYLKTWKWVGKSPQQKIRVADSRDENHWPHEWNGGLQLSSGGNKADLWWVVAADPLFPCTGKIVSDINFPKIDTFYK